MQKGLIVCIQGYSQTTIQEIAEKLKDCNIAGIRADKVIKINKPVISLEKLPEKKYYITTSVDAIIRCSWGDYIAIDCRRGNFELQLLLAYAQINNYKIVADIEDIRDVEELIRLNQKNGFNLPAYISTTFSFLKTGLHNFNLIKEIVKIIQVPVIAEGKIKTREDVKKAYDLGASNVCIGAEISDIKYLTEKFIMEGIK